MIYDFQKNLPKEQKSEHMMISKAPKTERERERLVSILSVLVLVDVFELFMQTVQFFLFSSDTGFRFNNLKP